MDPDALSPEDRLKMEAARSIREDFLQQDSFDPIDTYASLKKQYLIMQLVLQYYDRAQEALARGADIEALAALPVREDIGRFKYVEERDVDMEYKRVSDLLLLQMEETVSGREDY